MHLFFSVPVNKHNGAEEEAFSSFGSVHYFTHIFLHIHSLSLTQSINALLFSSLSYILFTTVLSSPFSSRQHSQSSSVFLSSLESHHHLTSIIF
ncbi:hypothetical protein VNO77_33115 [Canavalia gladiata]|uniref:Uncharacterized protein n=1 Tax=Canavalia gladiata TaxID=3824 RepID=A0AAN9KF02_CANGL